MAKICERLLSTMKLRENRRDSFDPQCENLLGEDSVCMVILLETPRVTVFFITCLTCFGCFRREICFAKQASKSKSRYYRYTVRSIQVKL